MSQAAIESTVRSPASAAASGTARVAAHKFGGSSLADAECFRRVAQILRAQPEPHQLIVASAMRGTTDALIALADAAARRGMEWKPKFDELRDRHLAATRDLLGDRAQPTLDLSLIHI